MTEGQPIPPPEEGRQPTEPQYLSQDAISGMCDEAADPNCRGERVTEIQIALGSAAGIGEDDDIDPERAAAADFARTFVYDAFIDIRHHDPQLLKSPGVKAFFTMFAGTRPEGYLMGDVNWDKLNPFPDTSSDSSQK